jgi:hypothetical protein
MKKIVRLTESDLNRIIKKVLKEDIPSTSTTNYSAKANGGWITVSKTVSKPIIDPKTSKPIIDPKTSKPKMSNTTTSKNGCAVFTKSVKKNGKWVFDERWAQGVDEQSNKPFKIKFRFSWLIKSAVPDSLESMGFGENEIVDMFNKWSGNQPIVRIAYAKGTEKTDNESNADTKITITLGGPNANNICKQEW